MNFMKSSFGFWNVGVVAFERRDHGNRKLWKFLFRTNIWIFGWLGGLPEACFYYWDDLHHVFGLCLSTPVHAPWIIFGQIVLRYWDIHLRLAFIFIPIIPLDSIWQTKPMSLTLWFTKSFYFFINSKKKEIFWEKILLYTKLFIRILSMIQLRIRFLHRIQSKIHPPSKLWSSYSATCREEAPKMHIFLRFRKYTTNAIDAIDTNKIQETLITMIAPALRPSVCLALSFVALSVVELSVVVVLTVVVVSTVVVGLTVVVTSTVMTSTVVAALSVMTSTVVVASWFVFLSFSHLIGLPNVGVPLTFRNTSTCTFDMVNVNCGPLLGP